MRSYRIYAPNEKQWEQACSTDYYNPRKPDCLIIKNAIIEPPRKEESSIAGQFFRGGICNENGEFIVGLKRNTKVDKMSLDIYDSYKISGEIEHFGGNYIYGGVIIGIFGHVITDSLVYLWWIVKNNDNNDKIIFLSEHKNILPIFWKLVDILGIKDRIIIVEKVCQVDSIIVPDRSFIMYAEYTYEMTTVYKSIGSAILEKPFGDKLHKKVYLTRSQFSKHDCFGEDFFEKFYKKRGYEIIAPETIPFETQIRILNHAEEIVCSIGSMSHMLLFANNNKARITFLIRANEVNACTQQLMMNQAFNISYDIIDVSMNILPTTQADGCFLIGPTKYFINYLNDNNIGYDDEEIQMDWSCLHDYLSAYANKYNKDAYPFRRIKNLDMFDVINQMNFVFNGTQLDRNKMQTKSKCQLENEIKNLNALKNNQKVIKFSYHFAQIGWINDIDNIQPVVKPYQIEAIRIDNLYPDCNLRLQVRQKGIGWQSSEKQKGSLTCGVTGKALPLTAVCIEIRKECKDYKILYRAYMKTTGWTRICENGEICGSISQEGEDIIIGLQIILIDRSLDSTENYLGPS